MKLESTELLRGRRFDVVQIRQEIDGRIATREVVRHPGAVAIIPMVDDDHVCLIRNYRVAVDETLIELPAGTLEANEEAKVTAERELIEETGYTCGRCEQLHEFYLSPGILDEKMRLFLATQLVPGETQREHGEQIENLVVPWDEALAMVFDGRIHDAKTIVGLLFYETARRRRRDGLR